MRVRFSIIIPCYNQGPFLRECLDSVTRQTRPADEVIVVDDGSTDPYTVARIDELCVGGVRRLRQPNRGPSAARNAGIEASSGDWVLPLDADDLLTPDALAEYEDAIAGDSSVDIWYPDMELFGHEQKVADMAPFDRWRLLWGNFIVNSSLFRRSMFDSGVRYDERMRAYEDWAFWVHACCDRTFRAERLQRPVFRYRRWGYSHITAADDRRERLVDQLQRCRPIYGDPPRLDELKRAFSPFFAIAAESEQLGAALERQSFRDARVVDCRGAVLRDDHLGVFQKAPGSHLLVSIDDRAFAQALDADHHLLEKLALSLRAHDPGFTWVERGPRVAFVTALSLFLERRPIAAGSEGLVKDLERHAVAIGAPVRVFAIPVVRPAKATPDERERMVSGPSPVEEPPTSGQVRLGPVPPLTIPIVLQLRQIAADAPRFGSVQGSAVLLAMATNTRESWVTTLLGDTSARAVLLTEDCAYAPDAFSLADIGGSDPAHVFADLVRRHDVRVVLIADALQIYHALPVLARFERRPRVIARLRALGPGSLGEEMAVRYNNLIDSYLVSSSGADPIDDFCARCYVSPSKVHTVDDRGLAAELKRFTA